MQQFHIPLIAIIALMAASLACGATARERGDDQPEPTEVLPARTEDAVEIEPSTIPSPTKEALSQFITDEQGVPMALVPAGEFQMGSESVYECEQPIHTVSLDAFYNDQYEVTTQWYAECVNAGTCEPPSSDASASRDSYFDHADFTEYPVMFFSWNVASAYCEWRGGRLPTEAEWERAARGGLEGQLYPWGDKFDGTLLNYCDANCTFNRSDPDFDDGYISTAPVGSYPPNDYGLYDMAGNLLAETDVSGMHPVYLIVLAIKAA